MNVRWLVDRMVVLSVYNNFLNLHFHAPIEATYICYNCSSIIGIDIYIYDKIIIFAKTTFFIWNDRFSMDGGDVRRTDGQFVQPPVVGFYVFCWYTHSSCPVSLWSRERGINPPTPSPPPSRSVPSDGGIVVCIV